jgi:hypothetical protein
MPTPAARRRSRAAGPLLSIRDRRSSKPLPAAISPVVPRSLPSADAPAYRALRVYAFDPSRGRRLGNYMTVRVKYERLDQGLRGAKLHVIDYDAANKRYYQAANLNSPAALVEAGLEPSESDPRFHQQMVYAIAMQTISIFERALGRDVHYAFLDNGVPRDVLHVFPHAMCEPNAYYSRELGALLFGYFRASADDAGSGLPGGTVFTCLSHDIVAHETTHSVVDTLRSSFMEATNPDVPAFHEAFADIVALFQHFSFEDVVCDTLQRTGGMLHHFELAPRGGNGKSRQQAFIIGEMPEDNPLLDLARQFGESMGRRAALRSALGVPPDPTALSKATEPHERGAVLVAAVFDAFFSSFMARTADLLRLARAASGGSDEIHPDVAARLAREAAKTASHFCTMCIRALDYCPPVDITFGEFLRALITADTELYESDEHDYRDAFIQAFRARGIYPDGVESLAEESLIWDEPDPRTPRCRLLFDLLEPEKHVNENMAKLEELVRGKGNAVFFGVCDDGKHAIGTCTCRIEDAIPVVKSVHTVMRVGDQRPRVEFVAEIVRSVPLHADHPQTLFSGGATVMFDSGGNAKRIVYKKLSSESRRSAQKKLTESALAAAPASTYIETTDAPMHLSAIHRGC